MKKLISVVVVLVIMSGLGIAFANPLTPVRTPTGEFGLPYNENQIWSACGDIGWKPITQYHTEWNTDYSKYHLGEDWNGVCGTDTDEGYPLLAIADGKVVYIDNYDEYASEGVQGRGKQLYIRYSFPYAFGVNDILTFDSAYAHITGVADQVTWSGPGTGSNVSKGQEVAFVGSTGGPWYAHLHWEAQWDDSLSVDENPYRNPLIISDALKYRAPSLIVDDHKNVSSHSTTSGQWVDFTMSGYAPGSIAYFEYGSNVKTIKDAISAGWVNSYGVIFSKDGGTTWEYYVDADDNFFENGVLYSIYANVSGLTFKTPVPQNQLFVRKDRARLDMLHAVENDSDFASVKMDTETPYGYNPNWSTDFELHYMAFNLSGGGYAYANQAALKSNPLIRYTCYYDPTTSSWTSWQEVGWNNLY